MMAPGCRDKGQRQPPSVGRRRSRRTGRRQGCLNIAYAPASPDQGLRDRISPFWAIRRNALASAVDGSGGFCDPALTATPSLGFSRAPLFVIDLGEDPDSLGHANSPSEVFDLNTAFDTGAAFFNRFFGSGRE